MQQTKTSEGKYIFNINEWLTTGQIRSYFSRMRRSTMKKIDQMSSSGDSRRTTYLQNVDEEEQDPDGEADAEVNIFSYSQSYMTFSVLGIT
jgi:hypothetical protein